MTNDLLDRLTGADIKEIEYASLNWRRLKLRDAVTISECDKYCEYVQSEEFYNDVVKYMKEINHYKPPCKERYPVLLEQAEYVTNCTLDPESRKAENVFIKSIVAYQLHEEGYSYSEIGRTIGMSHATIIHYVNKMNDMFSIPQMYTTEITQYEQFKEIADTI